MIEKITFHTEQNKLIVTLDDGTTREYTQAEKDQYITDFPDRVADVEAMGW